MFKRHKYIFIVCLVAFIGVSGVFSSSCRAEIAQNMLCATIFDESIEFYLSATDVRDTVMEAIYIAYDPRGNERYKMRLWFSSDIAPGDFDSSDGQSAFEITLFSNYISAVDDWTDRYHAGSLLTAWSYPVVTPEDSYHLILTYRDSEWKTYQGTFSADMKNSLSNTNLHIKDASFDFSLGEIHPYIEEKSITPSQVSINNENSESAAPVYPASPLPLSDVYSGQGTGAAPSSPSRMCGVCFGSGRCHTCNGNGRYYSSAYGIGKWSQCSSCGGSGICSSCGGTGTK